MDAEPYADAVFGLIQRQLVGPLDDEEPVIVVESVEEVTGPGDVLAVAVAYRSRNRAYGAVLRFDEWEPFDDPSAESQAAGLLTQLRDHVRESVEAQPPQR